MKSEILKIFNEIIHGEVMAYAPDKVLILHNYIDSLESENKKFIDPWILIEDKLPELDKLVLVYRNKPNRKVKLFILKLVQHGSVLEWQSEGEMYTFIKNAFTHWAPLPKTPILE